MKVLRQKQDPNSLFKLSLKFGVLVTGEAIVDIELFTSVERILVAKIKQKKTLPVQNWTLFDEKVLPIVRSSN